MSRTPASPATRLEAEPGAASGSSRRPRGRRTPEAADAVLTQIRSQWEQGATLRRAEMIERAPELVRAAEVQFGMWRTAVRRTGLPVRHNERWDDARVVTEIRRLHRRGFTLSSGSVDPTLLSAAILHVGSWRRAVERAGLDYERVAVRHGPSRAELLALIRKRARARRTGISEDGLLSPLEAEQVRTQFGTVPAAIEEAGLDPTLLVQRRGYTKAQVATALQRLSREKPELTLKQLRRTGLAGTAIKLFGTLAPALEAAGLTEWPVPLRVPVPSQAETLTAVRKRYQSGASMTTTDAIREDRRLVKGVYKHFGTWRSALKIAGIPYDDDTEPMTRAQVRAELRARRKRHEPMSVSAIQRDDPALWRGVIERYGSLFRAEDDRRAAKRKARGESEVE